MLFLIKDRFLNPLVPAEMLKLRSSGLLNDKDILFVLHEHLAQFENRLPAGMYFPVPISRTLKEKKTFSAELAMQFHYDFIKVDDDQNWSLRRKSISGKVLKLFLSNLFYEKETARYFVEYWSDQRWDKTYLECAITPLQALSLSYTSDGFQVQLNNNNSDSIDPQSFRIDSRERCFVCSLNFGEILLADSPRFWLLNNLDETGAQIVVGKHRFPLCFSTCVDRD
ncbi:MAG: hypothetical protein H8E38_13790 [SAR324 cluster bacterium]|nr:hypothetical protein [SAR324 cluster bacterium]MBL7035883.1 hypothetical protein [SAR324 cluster bacterium]